MYSDRGLDKQTSAIPFAKAIKMQENKNKTRRFRSKKIP
jgi:hypothetical protein